MFLFISQCNFDLLLSFSTILNLSPCRGTYYTLFRTPFALGPTKPPIQRVPGALSLGIKLPGRETDLSSLSTAKIKNEWSYTSAPSICLHGLVLS